MSDVSALRAYFHKLLEGLLGYSFNEEDLSPKIQSKFASFTSQVKQLYETEQKIKKRNKKKKIILIIYLAIGIPITIYSAIAAVLLYNNAIKGGVPALILSILATILPSLLCLPYILRNPWKKKWNDEFRIFSKRITPILEEIHRELAEVHRLKLRPEIVEYKIITEFSLKDGAVVIKCPHCNGSLDLVKDKIEGNKYKCPYCGEFIVIPERILSLL